MSMHAEEAHPYELRCIYVHQEIDQTDNLQVPHPWITINPYHIERSAKEMTRNHVLAAGTTESAVEMSC
jgi:hypothetical protein